MRKEIGQRQMETKTLKEELDKRTRQIQKEKKEYDASNEEVEKLKVPFQVNVTKNISTISCWTVLHVRVIFVTERFSECKCST